mmetsp:Transcript_120526/g.336282  ORF Transcript_120526/g.336282 Transcript_120526/m.336282 type:complete len:350 (+) Transcript_120526:185-1234(+)
MQPRPPPSGTRGRPEAAQAGRLRLGTPSMQEVREERQLRPVARGQRRRALTAAALAWRRHQGPSAARGARDPTARALDGGLEAPGEARGDIVEDLEHALALLDVAAQLFHPLLQSPGLGRDAQQVLALGRPLQLRAPLHKLILGQGALAPQDPEKFFGVAVRQLQGPHLQPNLPVLACILKFLKVHQPVLVLVRHGENLKHAIDFALALFIFPGLGPLLISLSGRADVLDHNTDYNVHDAVIRDQQEDDEEANHVGLVVDDMSHDPAGPAVQRHDLQESVHAASDRAKVLVVVPATAQLAVLTVHGHIVADLRRQEQGRYVRETCEEHNDPRYGLDAHGDAVKDGPQLL